MRYREIVRKLRSLGCEFDRQGKGDHEVWINLENRRRTTVQNWGSKDIPAGTLNGILRDLGLGRDEINKA